MPLDLQGKKQVKFKNKRYRAWRAPLFIGLAFTYFAYNIYIALQSDDHIIYNLISISIIAVFFGFAYLETQRKWVIIFKACELHIFAEYRLKKKVPVHQIKAIDRNFDEWTIYLNNGKKIQFSDHEISKEEKIAFREIMNQLPKLHEHVYL